MRGLELQCRCYWCAAKDLRQLVTSIEVRLSAATLLFNIVRHGSPSLKRRAVETLRARGLAVVERVS